MHEKKRGLLILLILSIISNTIYGQELQNIFEASNDGHLQRVQELVEKGEDSSATDNNGNTVLMIAAYGGHLEVVKYLAETGADIDAINNAGYTALMLASEWKYLEILKYLIENGADTNAINTDGNTALMLASDKGYLEIVTYLVNAGADTSEMTIVDWTSARWLEKLKESIENNEDSNFQNDDDALMVASDRGYLEIVTYLVDAGADTSKMTIVDWASAGWLEKVKESIENNEDINFQDDSDSGFSALTEASRYGQTEVIKYLVESGADIPIPNDWGETALSIALHNEYTEIADYFKSQGATE